MSKVLIIKANPQPEAYSFTQRLAHAFIEAYQNEHPEDKIEILDLYHADIPAMDSLGFSTFLKLAGFDPGEPNQEEQNWIDRDSRIINQFIEADKVILAAPLWNLNLPAVVKAYIDALIIPTKTYPRLVKDKPFLLIQARGGLYEGMPKKSKDHADSYIRDVMGTIGIDSYHMLVAEGLVEELPKAEELLQEAIKKAQIFAKNF